MCIKTSINKLQIFLEMMLSLGEMCACDYHWVVRNQFGCGLQFQLWFRGLGHRWTFVHRMILTHAEDRELVVSVVFQTYSWKGIKLLLILYNFYKTYNPELPALFWLKVYSWCIPIYWQKIDLTVKQDWNNFTEAISFYANHLVLMAMIRYSCQLTKLSF